MAEPGGDRQIYATLLTGDSYLPGALVLAHSLRDAGTTKQLAVLVTSDSVSVEAIAQLRLVYDHVFPVPRIRNDHPNLHLMNRADLHSAFTKINLWKLTDFTKIVYIDADIVAYRAPDELFAIDAPFSAAPDIGWPDLFNTGVMVLKPNMDDYHAMMDMAEQGTSFDGADQGLLNMHFKDNYNRLSFSYNVTPSAHYQYVPAYRHFQSSINLVHFIGASKPWFEGRDAPQSNSPFDEMKGKWWAVYDRHYRVQGSSDGKGSGVSELVQYLTKGEFQPNQSSGEQHHLHHDAHGAQVRTLASQDSQPHGQSSSSNRSSNSNSSSSSSTSNVLEVYAEDQTVKQSWDAQRHSPPSNSGPEAANFPSTHYQMSQDHNLFAAPARYPSPPRGMWYNVPKDPPHFQAPPAIFPWESNRPQPARKFGDDAPAPAPAPEPAPTRDDESVDDTSEILPMNVSHDPAETMTAGESTIATRSETSTPTTPTNKTAPSSPWSSFSRTNAWDEMPEIERYVESLQKHRQGKSPGPIGGVQSQTVSRKSDRKSPQPHGLKLTDFPSEVERPSLPVTPAPIRRQQYWGGGAEPEDQNEDTGLTQVPAAEGVPSQSDWDPAEQLTKLAQQQSETLLRKLGSNEATRSPSSIGSGVLSPQPIKGKLTSSQLRDMAGGLLDPSVTTIPEPSYSGPGAAWERDENILQHETPMPPTEEERDVLQT